MDKKPNVFPTNQNQNSGENNKENYDFETEKMIATNEIYTNSANQEQISQDHIDAIEMMKRRTEEQLRLKNQYGTVQDPSLSETPKTRNDYEIMEIRRKAEEQIKLRDQNMSKNMDMIQNYQKQVQQVQQPKQVQEQPKNKVEIPNNQKMESNNYQAQRQENRGMSNTYPSIDPRVLELSQPDYNSPFDVIPLPSQGKIYRSKKSNIKVSFMNTLDENILTSPNLLQSGQFLEILLNRKILEPEIRYRDLDVGDRNAIMIWLRATGYGEMYPIVVLDNDGEPFETEINLNELKFKKLGAEPDTEGYFDFKLPLSKAEIKFKLLTCGDIDDIEKMVENEKSNGALLDNTAAYMLERRIVEVNGSRDRDMIKEFVKTMRILDSSKFSEYYASIESGIDLNIEVQTPRGGVVKTFLPLNVKFFWPNVKL